jgi:hypothetical protein
VDGDTLEALPGGGEASWEDDELVDVATLEEELVEEAEGFGAPTAMLPVAMPELEDADPAFDECDRPGGGTGVALAELELTETEAALGEELETGTLAGAELKDVEAAFDEELETGAAVGVAEAP